MAGGGGLVVVHAADNAFSNWPAWNEMIALGGWARFEARGAWTDQPLLSQILVILVVFAIRIVAVRWDWETRPADDLSDRMWSYWSRRTESADD